MITIKNDKIENYYLLTNVIKTSKLSNTRLDNGSTMTIQADKCDITNPSEGKLKLDETGNSQIFQISHSKDDSDHTILSIVPQNGKLEVESRVGTSSIGENSGDVRSADRGSGIEIRGINKATLDAEDIVVLRSTSNIILDFSDREDYDDINDAYEGWVDYYIDGVHLRHMQGKGVYTKIKEDHGLDASNRKYYIPKGTPQGMSTCPRTVTIAGGYDTTFKATAGEE